MGWDGLSAIRFLRGETRAEAIAPAFAGGLCFDMDEDGSSVDVIAGDGRDYDVVNAEERRWMLEAFNLMEKVRPGGS